MLVITLSNAGGVIDTVTAKTHAEAAVAAAQMIACAGELYDGDKIAVQGWEDGE